MTTVPSWMVRIGVVALIATTTIGVGVGVTSAAAATVRSSAGCTTVHGAPWKIKSLGSGSTYTLQAHGISCKIARAWVVKFTHETESGNVLKGPSGFKCESLASKLSGDTHVYDGECMKGTPATAILVWAPKP